MYLSLEGVGCGVSKGMGQTVGLGSEHYPNTPGDLGEGDQPWRSTGHSHRLWSSHLVLRDQMPTESDSCFYQWSL